MTEETRFKTSLAKEIKNYVRQRFKYYGFFNKSMTGRKTSVKLRKDQLSDELSVGNLVGNLTAYQEMMNFLVENKEATRDDILAFAQVRIVGTNTMLTELTTYDKKIDVSNFFDGSLGNMYT